MTDGPPTANTRTRNPRGTGGRLRDEIVDAAIRLLDETEDPASLTLRGIARATGVQAPSIYTHFSGVDDVIEALRDRSFTQLESEVRDALATSNEPRTALGAAAHAYVNFGWGHPARYRLMFASSGYAPHAVNTYMLVEETIGRCWIDSEGIDRDPHQDTFLLWVALHGIATLERPERADLLRLGPLDRVATVDQLVDRLVLTNT